MNYPKAFGRCRLVLRKILSKNVFLCVDNPIYSYRQALLKQNSTSNPPQLQRCTKFSA